MAKEKIELEINTTNLEEVQKKLNELEATLENVVLLINSIKVDD